VAGRARARSATRFLAAVLLEAAWEVFENTPFVIDRYRTATIALDYYGDSVVNSVSDIGAMMCGFWLARRLPSWASVRWSSSLEVFVVLMIRDNLTLNILMLLYPLDAIRRWQSVRRRTQVRLTTDRLRQAPPPPGRESPDRPPRSPASPPR
jgi:hypothetical protein